MTLDADTPWADAHVGICVSCAHSAHITSSRGSDFWRCERSATDPAFPKYPRLPVVACAGYERVRSDPAATRSHRTGQVILT